MDSFDYNEFTTRNIGFVTNEEQLKLKDAIIFIAGTGGMGGAAIACLARCGVGEFIFADIDEFELSNLNRQIFANLETINQSKAAATKAGLLNINPELKLTMYGGEWTEEIDTILPKVDLAINGCDDVKATLLLMRKGKEHGKIIIDAFASTLPSVYVVQPHNPRPEVTFKYPSVGREIHSITQDEEALIVQREIEYVMTHSSASNHVILEVAAEMVSGNRSRFSFAPMVWMTGCMMGYEAVKIILDKKTLASHRGVFFNPWKFRVEKPLNPIFAFFKGYIVKKFLKDLMK